MEAVALPKKLAVTKCCLARECEERVKSEVADAEKLDGTHGIVSVFVIALQGEPGRRCVSGFGGGSLLQLQLEDGMR